MWILLLLQKSDPALLFRISCFKCVQSAGPKPQVTLFMADSQDDMDKWLSVLSAACRGEDIQKTSQQQQQQQQKHLPVKDDVGVQKRKSASNPKQRTSSVLGECFKFLVVYFIKHETFCINWRSTQKQTSRKA